MMAMDAVPFDLLRSSLDDLKLRFQAVAAEPGAPIRAWMAHVHIKRGEKPAIYSHLVDMIDSYYWPTKEPTPSALLWQLGTAAIGRGVPPFRREIRVKCSTRLSTIGTDAAKLLDSLPPSVAVRLWRDLPAKTQLLAVAGFPRWALACFELANANVVGSPLRAVRNTPITEEQARTVLAVGLKLPADADWYAMLPDFAAASVQAIDILQSWLGDELKRETEATSEQPKPVAQQAETLAGGDGAGIVEKTPGNARAANKPVELLGNGRKAQRCEILAYYASRYAELKLERKLTAQDAYDYWKEYGFDPADKHTENAAELAGYQLRDSFETFKTQLSKGRSAFNDRRNETRKGRKGRSIVRGDEID